MDRRWRWFLPYYIWSLPLVIVGLVLAAVYRSSAFRWHDGVLTCVAGRLTLPDGSTTTRIWGRPGAQTFGWLQIYAGEKWRERTDLRVHETVHTGQALYFSIGGMAAYPPIHYLYGRAVTGFALGGFVGVAAYALAYVGAFLGYFAGQGFKDWKAAYNKNPFEKQAYAIEAKEIKTPGEGRWGE